MDLNALDNVQIEKLLRDKVRESVSVDFAIHTLGFSPEEFPEHGSKTISWMELLVRRLLTRAAVGDAKALTDVMDRLIGRPASQAPVKPVTNNTYIQFLNSCVVAEDASPRIVTETIGDDDDLDQFFTE